MNRISGRRTWALVVLVAFMVAACSMGGGGASMPPATGSVAGTSSAVPGTGARTPVDLTVFGAASLTGVLDEVERAYEAGHPWVSLVVSTDSSAALATQIEQGAPADVFLSADTANARRLVDEGLADGAAVPFADNQLAIIVPHGNPARITTPADLARPGIKVVAAGAEVPITRYADQLVANLAAEPGYPADFVAAYAANVVSREDNVEAVLAKVELGEGDAGIVYFTDVATSMRVDVIDIPAGANVVARYAGVVVRDSTRPADARAFLDWLTGADGQAILGSFGFVAPS